MAKKLPTISFRYTLVLMLCQPDSCKDFAGRVAFKPLKRGFYHIVGFILDFTMGEGQTIAILISGATSQRFPL
jgi:hypothetical protein